MMLTQPPPTVTGTEDGRRTLRVSIVMEWANTHLNGVSRAQVVLDELDRQWRLVTSGDLPADASDTERSFLATLAPEAELLIVSGEAIDAATRAEIEDRQSPGLQADIHIAEGLEYYPLKNFGIQLTTGDIVLLIDSDVIPDPGWLAYLLSSFERGEVSVVAGQPYVGSDDLFSRAFALGWIFDRRYPSPDIEPAPIIFSSNIAFRSDAIRPAGFPCIGSRTRGAAQLLRRKLERRGITLWLNRRAYVDHPPPSNLRHMLVRALAHGRDFYGDVSEQRNLRALRWSLGTAVTRNVRAWRACILERSHVGLPAWQVPAAWSIIATYYLFFAAGGVITYIDPKRSGRRFRV